MTKEEKERWDEANKVEHENPNNAYVVMNAIRIRQEILEAVSNRSRFGVA
jgi:hypothetical protein